MEDISGRAFLSELGNFAVILVRLRINIRILNADYIDTHICEFVANIIYLFDSYSWRMFTN